MVKAVLHAIDVLNEKMGNAVGWIIIPLALLIVMEVILRYVFNKPTMWAWDVEVQLQGVLIALGGGYALLRGSHVSVDILASRLSSRKRAIVDAVTGPVLIAALSLLLWKVAQYSWNSILIREDYTSTWGPPIYPLKVIIFVGISAMLLQGIAKWIRDLMRALQRGGAGD
ncbi:hypothetical protein ES703_79538 [subsurface metagenome]